MLDREDLPTFIVLEINSLIKNPPKCERRPQFLQFLHLVCESLHGAFLATRVPLRKEVYIEMFMNFQFYSLFFYVTLNS
ncbi:MAG: hypothetical protein ACTSQP_20115 [Promethearchaeota archaeon]